jgi:pyrroloquinoline quinone (PQQ) biosynthesis protein C
MIGERGKDIVLPCLDCLARIPIMRSERETMGFADGILTEDLEPLRQRLLTHPLWTGIEQGTLPRETLRVFALQDWWLVRQAYRLDALAVAAMPDLDLQDLLLAKLVPKLGGYRRLLRFGEALGLSRADFDAVEPLAGCMALTTFFYWMLAYGSVPEKIAAVGASEEIYIRICARVCPALMSYYGMSAEQVAFFSAHEEIGQRVTPIDALLLAHYDTPQDRRLITRAVRLSHEFELLFYDTIMGATTNEF